jgi:hypothetical protein
MPYLKVVMTKAEGESNSKLLSATVSCITAIWTVFGKDKFGDDTQQVNIQYWKCKMRLSDRVVASYLLVNPAWFTK